MALASVAIRSARIYLNDINGITWTDAILMPLLQEAHGELVQELELNNTGTMKVQSSPIIVNAGDLDLGANQPTTIINPISMVEGDVGSDPDSFLPMQKLSFVPYTDQTTELRFWSWIGETIKFVGATSTRQIVLRYEGMLATPTKQTDPLGCIFAERFIGPRIAALAFATIGRNNDKVQAIADANLYKLIQSQVTNDQRPHRRKAYRSFKGFSGPSGVSAPLSVAGGGGSVLWVVTTTPPDGTRTGFVFGRIPKYVSWNGVNQFPGVGYTLAVTSSQYTVTFVDNQGNTLTPQVGDDIQAEYN